MLGSFFLFGYIGPDLTPPIASALATILGVVLMFSSRLLRGGKRVLGEIFRKPDRR